VQEVSGGKCEMSRIVLFSLSMAIISYHEILAEEQKSGVIWCPVPTQGYDACNQYSSLTSVTDNFDVFDKAISGVMYNPKLSKNVKELGVPMRNNGIHYDLLKWTIFNLKPNKDGLWLEFGVYNGKSANLTAILSGDDKVVYGFDTFTGLPEEWVGVMKQG
jgi:hypothetical protein